MEKQINPTRMELLKLKKKLEVTIRGHKLLKDKQNELISLFIPLLERYKTVRQMVEENLITILKLYKRISVDMHDSDIQRELNVESKNLVVSYQKKLGIDIPVYEYDLNGKNDYSLENTNIYFDILIKNIKSLGMELIKLAEIESQITILVDEVKKSRRRVNAIENIVIEEIKIQIKSINMKLADLERSNTIRAMKSKEIILNKEKK
ncbi:V-type ATP synthase subunit D [Haploplasma axanthum]|nr:V-type ATP synthase subunit D [Haploplasma axanthum]